MLAGVLIERILSLKDSSPLIIINDSILQGGRGVLKLFENRTKSKDKNAKIIYLAFEGTPACIEVDYTINCIGVLLSDIQDMVNGCLHKIKESKSTTIIMIDSLNYITSGDVAPFLSSLIRPGICIIGVFHCDLPISNNTSSYYPDPQRLLSYLATSILIVNPVKHHHDDDYGGVMMGSSNNQTFVSMLEPNSSRNDVNSYNLTLIHRRKSGRSIAATFLLTQGGAKITFVPPHSQKEEEESSSASIHETTFNLSLSDKQRQEKDKVNLPFMAAQQVGSGGAEGGAIVYQYEKEDDYDEEDPYEDPF